MGFTQEAVDQINEQRAAAAAGQSQEALDVPPE